MIGNALKMRENFRPLGVFLGRDVSRFFEQGHIDIGFDVTRSTRIAAPIPGAAKIPRAVDDAEIGDALLLEIDRGQQPADPAADDHNISLFDHRIAREVRVGIGIAVKRLEHPFERLVLLHTIGAQTLLPLVFIFGLK